MLSGKVQDVEQQVYFKEGCWDNMMPRESKQVL